MGSNGQSADWQKVRVEDLGSWKHGGTPSKSRPELWNGSVPWASGKDLKRPRITDTIDHLSQMALDEGTPTVAPGCLLMLVRGMSLANSFPVSLAMSEMAFNQDLKALTPAAKFDAEYLLQWFLHNQQTVLALVDDASHGTKRLASERFYSLTLEVPGLRVQRQISKILRSVDAAIESTRAVIAQTRQLKTALLQDLLTNGLPGRHTEFDEVYRIGRVPRAWAETKIKDAAEVLQGIALGPHRNPDKNPTPYLRVANVHQSGVCLAEVKHIETSQEEREKYALRSHDVLMVEGHASLEELGRAALVPADAEGMVYQNHLFRVRPFPSVLDPRFLVLWINSPPGREYFQIFGGTTSGLNTVGSNQIRNLRLPVPPIEEQTLICDAVEKVGRSFI